MDEDKHILSTNHSYFLRMRNGSEIKFMKVDMTTPYHSINDVFYKMDNYIKDGVCWKLVDKKIYMCCSPDETIEVSDDNIYSRYTVWFVKLRNIEEGYITYMSTQNTKIFPVLSFKEVFNNITVPEGYIIEDYDNLYLCNTPE